MQNKNVMKSALIVGAVAVMVVGLLFFLTGDRVFGGVLLLAGLVELVMLPLILRKMEDMNR